MDSTHGTSSKWTSPTTSQMLKVLLLPLLQRNSQLSPHSFNMLVFQILLLMINLAHKLPHQSSPSNLSSSHYLKTNSLTTSPRTSKTNSPPFQLALTSTKFLLLLSQVPIRYTSVISQSKPNLLSHTSVISISSSSIKISKKILPSSQHGNHT